MKAQWSGHGWKRPSIGRVKIKKGVKPYGGKWVPLIEIRGDEIIVFIEPSERSYKYSEIENFETDS